LTAVRLQESTTMRKSLASASIVLVSTMFLQAFQKPPAEVPVYILFGNSASDGVASDGSTVVVGGTVADYADGTQNVLAVIGTTGNFRFSTSANTRKPAQRAACVNFGSQFADRAMPVPFTHGSPLHCGDALQAMHNYPVGDVAIQNLGYGQSVQKLVRFTWTDGGYYYRVGYGSDMDQNGVIDSPPVTVTCIAPSNATSPCTRWVLAPQDAAGTAVLFRFRILKNGEGPAEALGSFALPFTQTFGRL